MEGELDSEPDDVLVALEELPDSDEPPLSEDEPPPSEDDPPPSLDPPPSEAVPPPEAARPEVPAPSLDEDDEAPEERLLASARLSFL